MRIQLGQVQKWCEATGINVPTGPTTLPIERATLRFNLMAEENTEYLEAIVKQDVVEIADALGDMLYILLGTMLEHGMQDYIVRVFTEIHSSNMSKMGEDGKPILREDGKILKSQFYSPPKIKQILEK